MERTLIRSWLRAEIWDVGQKIFDQEKKLLKFFVEKIYLNSCEERFLTHDESFSNAIIKTKSLLPRIKTKYRIRKKFFMGDTDVLIDFYYFLIFYEALIKTFCSYSIGVCQPRVIINESQIPNFKTLVTYGNKKFLPTLEYLYKVYSIIGFCPRFKPKEENSELYPFEREFDPNPGEVRLIDFLIYSFTNKYIYNISLPTFVLTNESPPLLKQNNIQFTTADLARRINVLESIPEEKKKLKGSEKIDRFDIDLLLGSYIAREEKIKIYRVGIVYAANEMNLPSNLLFSIVLIHLVAHWIAHKLPCRKTTEWPIDYFEKSEATFHELWAQLLTIEAIYSDMTNYWNRELKIVFDALNSKQSESYLLYKNYLKLSRWRAGTALARLRRLQRPITLSDWDRACAR